MKNTLLNMYRKEAVQKVLASLLSIVIGLVVGAVVVAIVGLTKKNIGLTGMWDGVRLIFFGIFAKGRDTAGQLAWGFNPRAWGDMLFRATPVIMTGLSVAIAFKTGLFNIGAAGQYTLGAFGALYCAIVLQLPWYLCLLAAMLFGAISGSYSSLFLSGPIWVRWMNKRAAKGKK